MKRVNMGGGWNSESVEPLATRVPKDKHVLYLADLWAHTAAYGMGLVGGAVVCVATWRRTVKGIFQLPATARE